MNVGSLLHCHGLMGHLNRTVIVNVNCKIVVKMAYYGMFRQAWGRKQTTITKNFTRFHQVSGKRDLSPEKEISDLG